jgi:hypothetical protein
MGTNEFERAKGFLGIGKRIPRPGNAHDRELRNLRRDREHLPGGEFRRELLTHHARPAFVRTVVFAVAIVALDVARRRHCHVHACEIVVCIGAIAGMVLDAFPNRIWQAGFD